MNNRAIFPISVLMSFVAFGIVTTLYLAPLLSGMSAVVALQALVTVHTYRFIGLSFLLSGVVNEELSAKFAGPAAYGDLIAAVLAVIAVLMLHEHLPRALFVTWLFNILGTVDLMNAMSQGIRIIGAHPKGAGVLGAAFFIPTLIVPALLVTHGLVFWLLLRGAH